MKAPLKRILITGASSGLGEGLALAFAAPGVTLGLVARREDDLRRVAEHASREGATCLVYVADVTDRLGMERVLNEFADAAGGIDVVIANAGIGEGKRDARLSAESSGDVLNINVQGLINTLMPAVPVMVEQRSGVLVGMASVAGYRAMPGSLAYSTSKAAVMTFMEGLSMELHGTGVSSVCLCPGFVRTPLTDKNEFSMPFLLECDDACRRMKWAIEKRLPRYTFPLPMALLAQVLRLAPRWLVMRSSPRFRHRKKRLQRGS